MNEPSPFRQAFTLWERTSAAYLETLTRNPLFLGVNSGWLNGFLMVKKATDSGMRTLLSSLGLPTRHDQERTLHLLQQIEARLDDLEYTLRQKQNTKAED